MHKDVRIKLRTRQGGKCCYCERKMSGQHPQIDGKSLPPTAETVEHLKRKFEGGTHTLDNLALACLECNGRPGVVDWFTY